MLGRKSEKLQTHDPDDMVAVMQTVLARRRREGLEAGVLRTVTCMLPLVSLAFCAGKYVGEKSIEEHIPKSEPIEQNVTEHPNRDPGLANAVRLAVSKVCETEPGKTRRISQGTGALYKKGNSYSVGTVAHVISGQGGMNVDNQNCSMYVEIPDSTTGTSFMIPERSFESSYTRPTSVRATVDQPVFAQIPDEVGKILHDKEEAGELTPIEAIKYQAGKAMIIYRDMRPGDTANGFRETIFVGQANTQAEDNSFVINYTMTSGNTCPGNSGAPLLLTDVNGEPTNKAVGVLSTTVSGPGQACGLRGDAIGFQP